MEVEKIINLIENFAPLEYQEGWDCSGWQIKLNNHDVKKILLCLSVTKNIINQAVEMKCDLIISHHPLFFVPLSLNKGISIYSAHTNLDKASGGTTDTLIELLGFIAPKKVGEFLRTIEMEKAIQLNDFISSIKSKLNIENIRVVNNFKQQKIKKTAFCAGSGTDFIPEAKAVGADLIVTGDVKYHTAIDSDIIIVDVGHFESERPVLKKLETLLKPLNVEVMIANEKSPFINY